MLEERSLRKETVKWTIHPVRDSWKTTSIAVSVIALAAISVFLLSNSLFLSGASLLILVSSLSSFFLPTEYQLGPDSISVKGPFSRKLRSWGDFRKYYPGSKGVLLSPFPHPSRLDSFRGVYVRFRCGISEEERTGLIEFIGSKVGS
jgi:hypothetical protein